MDSTVPFTRKGFTLVELLVATVMLVILGSLAFTGYRHAMGLATRADCSSNLRQLSAAVNLYSADHHGLFPPYVENLEGGGRRWFFGVESSQPGVAEGDRELDREAGPLYPYIEAVGGIEICKGFNYAGALWKPKFKGASYGYGYNWWLGGRMTGQSMNIAQLNSSANIMLFGDCGQINTFQKPASAKNPMIEEFYILNESYKTVHFRHAGTANIVFVDGHVEAFKPYPGTEEKRIQGELLGRISPAGSTKYIR